MSRRCSRRILGVEHVVVTPPRTPSGHDPGVLPYEISNVLSRLRFDGMIGENDMDHIWSDFDQLGIDLHPFEQHSMAQPWPR